MFICMRIGRIVSCIAAAAMIASPSLAAEKASRQLKTAKVYDVTISKDGTLVGQLLTTAGQPKASAEVVAVSKSKVISKARTDARGVFQLPVKSAGIYRIGMDDQTFTVRAWNQELAPPATHDSLLCVTKDPTMRGQGAGSGLMSLLTNPVFIGLGVVAAIAGPIIADEVSDDDDDVMPSAS